MLEMSKYNFKYTFSDFLLKRQHRWFSGRMLACHAGGPGSIPGRCSQPFFFPSVHLIFTNLSNYVPYTLYFNPLVISGGFQAQKLKNFLVWYMNSLKIDKPRHMMTCVHCTYGMYIRYSIKYLIFTCTHVFLKIPFD